MKSINWLNLKRRVRFGDCDSANVIHFHNLLKWSHEAWEESMDKYGIPNQSPKRGMFSIPAVKDLVSWMQVIGKGNLKDIALYRIIKNKYAKG